MQSEEKNEYASTQVDSPPAGEPPNMNADVSASRNRQTKSTRMIAKARFGRRVHGIDLNSPNAAASMDSYPWSGSPNASNLAYVHHASRFYGGEAYTVNLTGKKIATPRGQFQVYRIFKMDVGTLMIVAHYGINEPEAYVDIRGKDKSIVENFIQSLMDSSE
ncbi:hypothetical protein B0H14DRAFT_2572145 [Mycena olivaceomarginata]|nr:hypothetical protein B0H14DRAFT_2572145 [Mycena olivaceomarginata]